VTPSPALRALPGGDDDRPRPDAELAALVRAAVGGDAGAVTRLVDRFERKLRSVTRFYGLSQWDADDVIQATWLAFLEHGRTLREGAAVRAWLETTARRQCLRVLQGRLREQPTEDRMLDEGVHDDPHDAMFAGERRAALLDALEELPLPRRRLMTLLVAKPDMSYEEVGRTLGMPVGSIGPTRLRSISTLRRSSKLQALRAES
jgi:RNA polymerase sigma factor (sigma-70 family)